MDQKRIYLGGLFAVIIIGSIVGYSIYQSSGDQGFKGEVSLSYNQWKHTNTYNAKLYDYVPNLLILEDLTKNYRIEATLTFSDIIVGRMNLQLRNDATLNREMTMRFKSDNKQIWFIYRASDGSYWFGLDPIGFSFYDGDANFHDYYIEWDFSGDTKEITVKFDNKIMLENYVVSFSENSINTIVWETFDYHYDSKTILNVDGSYLKSYL